MEVRPIGFVRNTASCDQELKGVDSRIEVLPEFADGLYRIEENDELMILFIFDRSSGFQARLHPKNDPQRSEVGVFASRSPRRPNPIGVTQVRLVKREGNVLTVEGLDAFDGSPVIDIKPAARLDQRCTSEK
jgi:tRNA-Thr(GGU) m(6)t(6)A37 methyltransferase TsaA